MISMHVMVFGDTTKMKSREIEGGGKEHLSYLENVSLWLDYHVL